MSGTLPAHDPVCVEADSRSVELLLEARPRDLAASPCGACSPPAGGGWWGNAPFPKVPGDEVEFISLPET
jgi:hypothetical protein